MFPRGSILEYNKVLNAIAQMNNYVTPVTLFKRLTNAGVKVTSYTLTLMIKCFSHLYKTKQTLGFLSWAIKIGDEPTHIMYYTLLHGLIDQGLTSEARDLLQKLGRDGIIEESPYVYSTLIKSWCRDKEYDRARESLLMMEQRRIPSNVKIYGNIIQSLCEDGELDHAKDLLERMKIMNIKPDRLILHSILHCMVVFHLRIKEGRLFIKSEMPKYGVTPGCLTYTILIKGLCEAGFVHEGEDVLDMMISQGITPDAIAYNQLISAYSNKKHKLEEANHVFDRMKKAGLKPDIFTFNSLMHGYARASRFGDAFRVFDEMSKHGVQPDVISANTLLHETLFALNYGHKSLPLKLFNKMTRHDTATYHIFIEGLCIRGKLDEALGLFRITNAIPPRVNTFNVMMHSALKSGNLQVMESIWKDFKSEGLEPNVTTYNIRIKGLALHGRLDEAIEIFESSYPESGDWESFNLIIQQLLRTKRIPEAFDFIKAHEEERRYTTSDTFDTAAQVLDNATFERILRALEIL